MTHVEKLAALKAMVGHCDDDSVLHLYLMLAAKKILARAYPYDDTKIEVPSKYEALHLEIAAYMINKRGAEGEISHSENGISRAYEKADIPESLLTHIVPNVGVI